MWRPRSEAEIQTAIDNGTTVETSSFDAKRELPAAGKNKDLAKDICAMTVDGGTLLYGLGGEDPTRPKERFPFATQGARERVDSVAQTAIQEPPVIDVYEIDSEENPGSGYLCVVVPPSPRAPHMLTSDGDNRFWGRGLTGNRILSESEVARLYERRSQWDVDRDATLEEVAAEFPFEFDPAEIGVMLVTIRPVAPGRELLRLAAGQEAITQMLQLRMTECARSRDPYPNQGTSGLGDAMHVVSSRADVWLASRETDLASRYQAYAEFAANGAFSYWHSPLLNRTRNATVIMEQSVTRALYQPLAVAEWLFDRAGFHGSTDVGLAVLGIEGAGGASLINTFGQRTAAYGASEYRRHARVTGEELRGDLDNLVRRLLRPLYEVTSVSGYDPLADRVQ